MEPADKGTPPQSPFYISYPLCLPHNYDSSRLNDSNARQQPMYFMPTNTASSSVNTGLSTDSSWYFMDPYNNSSTADMRMTYPLYAFPGPMPQLSNNIEFSTFGQPVMRPKRSQVKVACVNCKKACKKCDEQRPCPRCTRMGLTDTCVSAPRKPRPLGLKRGPYVKKDEKKELTPPKSYESENHPNISSSTNSTWQQSTTAGPEFIAIPDVRISPSTSPSSSSSIVLNETPTLVNTIPCPSVTSGLDILSLICDQAQLGQN